MIECRCRLLFVLSDEFLCQCTGQLSFKVNAVVCLEFLEYKLSLKEENIAIWPVIIYSQLDVRGSVHHSTIHKEKSNKMQQCIKILLFHIYT